MKIGLKIRKTKKNEMKIIQIVRKKAGSRFRMNKNDNKIRFETE